LQEVTRVGAAGTDHSQGGKIGEQGARLGCCQSGGLVEANRLRVDLGAKSAQVVLPGCIHGSLLSSHD